LRETPIQSREEVRRYTEASSSNQPDGLAHRQIRTASTHACCDPWTTPAEIAPPNGRNPDIRLPGSFWGRGRARTAELHPARRKKRVRKETPRDRRAVRPRQRRAPGRR
jgi:hypothetical protein